MPVPEYRYGKVTGLSPDLKVISERGESPMVCCGYCSAHMAASTAKDGLSTSMIKEAHAIRRMGGRAHNAGNTASELRGGTWDAVGVLLKSVSVADIPDRLRKGFAVTIGLDFGDLPTWLKVQKNDFGHACVLFGWQEADKRAGFFDPLWDQGARGAWVPWTQITPALWPDGSHSSTIERFSMSGSFAVFDAEVESRKVCDIATGVDFFRDVELTDKLGDYTAPATEQMFGQRSGAYAVQKATSKPYTDGVVRQSIVYIKAADAKNIRTLPAPVTPPPGGGYTEADLLKAKQEGYDLALSVFPPRPA